MAPRTRSPLEALRPLGLLTGRGRAPRSLLLACHGGRLTGALSVSLAASPDEAFGPLLAALGATARKLKLLDVRTGLPQVLEVQWGGVKEKWEVEDVAGLVHNLNDLFKDEADVAVGVVLGEWQDMLQLFCVPKAVLPALLATRLLDDARNVTTVRRLLEPREPEW